MKILAGTYKNFNIVTSKKLGYRPTKSRVRKSIFDRLNPYNYKRVLDLFAGTGIMGFEALSRGSKYVTMVENNLKSAKLIKKNCQNFCDAKISVIKKDVFNFFNERYEADLIFADPPYGKYDYDIIVKSAINKLAKNGKFILECNENIYDSVGMDQFNIGDTKLYMYTKL